MKRNRGFIDLSILFLAFTAVSLSSLIAFLAESTKVEQVPQKVQIMAITAAPGCPAGTKSERTFGECCGCKKAREVRECTQADGSKKYYASDCVHDTPSCNINCPPEGQPTPQPNCPNQKNQMIVTCIRYDCDGAIDRWVRVEKWCNSEGYLYEKAGRDTGLSCSQPKPSCEQVPTQPPTQLTTTPTSTPTPSCLPKDSVNCLPTNDLCCAGLSCQPYFATIYHCAPISNLTATPTPQSDYLTPTLAPSRCSLSSCTPLTPLICQQMGCEWRNNQCCPPTTPQPTTRPISTPTLVPPSGCSCQAGVWQGSCDSWSIGRPCSQPTSPPVSTPTLSPSHPSPTIIPNSERCWPRYGGNCSVDCAALVSRGWVETPDCTAVKKKCCLPKLTPTPIPYDQSCQGKYGGECAIALTCPSGTKDMVKTPDCEPFSCCYSKPTPTIIPNEERCWPRYGGECSFACTITKYRGYVETPDCTTEGKKCCLPKLTPTPIPSPTIIPNFERCWPRYGGNCSVDCASLVSRGWVETPDCTTEGKKCCLPKLTPTPIPYEKSCEGKYGGTCLSTCRSEDEDVAYTPDCAFGQKCCYLKTTPTSALTPTPTKKPVNCLKINGSCKNFCDPKTEENTGAKDCPLVYQIQQACCVPATFIGAGPTSTPTPTGPQPRRQPTPPPKGNVIIQFSITTETPEPESLKIFPFESVFAAESKVVPFAQVILTDNFGRTYETVADENGQVKLEVPAGFTYKVTVKAPGYKSAQRTIGYASPEKKYLADVNLVSGKETEKTETIKINAVTKPKTLKLSSGWSLVTLPLSPKTPFTASSLLKEINHQGGDAVMISRLENGGWQTYVLDLVGVDFEIEIGQAYFIFNNQAVEVSLAGEEVTAIPYNLSAGWNAVGFPKKLTLAQSAATTIDYLSTKQCNNETIEQCGNILSLSQFTSGLWETFLKDKGQIFGSDFYTENSQGYLLKLKSPLKITP